MSISVQQYLASSLVHNNQSILYFNRMTFKQEYLNRNAPFAFNFSQERKTVKDRIIELMRSFHPNEWIVRGFQPLSYLESFKQIYGIYSEQLTEIILELLQYLRDPQLSCEASISIMKTLVELKEYKIALAESFKFDNKYFIDKLKEFITYGTPFSLKNSDSYMENLIRLIKVYAKYGDEHFSQILEMAIEERDIKYLAIFIKSIKSIEKAQTILQYIFEESSLFERDTPFFFIISELTLEFPLLNLGSYHQTLSQEIIKVITTVVDPSTEDELKKLTNEDSQIGVQCTLKSVAKILVNCLRPISEPGWEKHWSCVERVFSIIAGLVDHSHEVECMNQFLIFMKEFVKVFQTRYRKQRGMYKEVNQDFVEEYQDQPSKNPVICQKYLALFDQIWMPLIPELLYFQDGQVLSAKILSDLAMLWPQKYLTQILDSIKVYLQKDLTICSSYTSKMTILFLQQFVIANYADHHEFTLLMQCCGLLLDALEVLGVSENLDMLQLVMRNYMYFPERLLEEKAILRGLTDDVVGIIEANLDPMSINLQSAEGEEAELYTDFKNIYFNFILRLNEKQIQGMCDKLLYKIKTMVPGHRQAYEFILVSLVYKSPQFAKRVLDYVYKQVVSPIPEKQLNNRSTQIVSTSAQIAEEVLPAYRNYSLATKNEQNLKWYCSLLECAFQYNPDNVVSQWTKLETIITLLLREFDTPNLFDYGLDILFNVIINLEHVHLEPKEFFKDQNRSYQTMKDIKWIHPSIESIALLEYIKNTFYESVTKYMQKKYSKIIQESQRAQKIKSQKTIQLTFDRSETSIGPKPIQVKQFINEILDCLLVPSAPSPSDIEQRKNINKLLSIQYSVFSALQMRCEFTSNTDMFEIQPVFIKELGSFRKRAIDYLKWVLQLLGHFNCLYDQSTLKLFHFFWREAHDELYFSTGISATNEKLAPYFYPTSYKQKQIFQNSFLIMTECYLTFMMRIELFSMLQPMAYLNNPQFLEYQVPFCFSSYLDCGLKSYVPAHVDPHAEFHFQILNISRLKLCLYNSSSYIRKFIVYSKAGNEGLNKSEKEKYLGAMRVVISNYKRSMGIFLYPCCIRDQTSWYGIQETVEVSQYFEKKTDKVAIIETIYLLIVFSFDFKGTQIYSAPLRMVQNGLAILTESDLQIQQKIVNYIKFLLQKISTEILKKFFQKDATVLVLLLICFSQFIPMQHEIHQQIIPLVFQITGKDSQDMMNMGKSFLFRILNRYIKRKIRIQTVANREVLREYEEFRVFRHIGGRTVQGTTLPPINLITSKTDNYYYPLHELQYLYRSPLDETNPNQALLLSLISTESSLRSLLKSLLNDTQLKTQQSPADLSYISEQQPKRIYSNGHKLINFILDNNPNKLDIFLSFIDNFSNYPICFYHRLFRKMLILGGQRAVQIGKGLAREFVRSGEKEEVKLGQFLLAELLPFCFGDQEFYGFYVNFIATCSNEEFQFANACLLVTFCVDWKISKIIFNKIIGRMREQKGPSRLRHFELFNNYLLCAGRFAQEEARDGIEYLMGGIEEGTDQVSQLIVSMLIYCFIVPINLKLLPFWSLTSATELISSGRIYKLDECTGYEINESVRRIVKQIVNRISQQKHMQSKNLMIYSKIAYKILSNITVHRFNDQFYRIFKDMMLYIVNKPVEEAGYDQEIVNQLKGSEYPQHIYEDLLNELTNMQGNTINVIKKKLRYIESIVINRIYCSNEASIPDIFSSINEKNITMDHIVAVSNMARIMKGQELTAEVEKILGVESKTPKNLKFMMAYLLAAGTRDFEWREKVLNYILSFKKHRLVKEFVSYWWKGRNPETEKEQRLCMLVRSVENPYSYFA